MSLKVYINGKLYDKEDAKISVYDHGLLYGDGVFEGIRSYGGKVFRLEAAPRPAVGFGQGHLAGDPHVTKAKMAEAVNETLAGQRRSTTATSAWSSPAAPAPWGSTPTERSDPQVIIITDKIALYPEESIRERAGDHHRQHRSATIRPR